VTAAPDLATLAKEFAEDLTRTMRAVVGDDCPPFIADTPDQPQPSGSSATVVRQNPAEGVVLRSGGEPLLTLTVEFRCAWDGHGSYLAVIWSRVAVYPRDDLGKEPLVRYEYIKDMRSGLPVAHIQIHGTHRALTEAMADAGQGHNAAGVARHQPRAGDCPSWPNFISQ
jgi:hypothetical protein